MRKSLSQPAPTTRLPKPIRRALTELLAHLCLIALGVTFALPFAWMLSTSLKPDQQVFILPPQWIPQPPKTQWSAPQQAAPPPPLNPGFDAAVKAIQDWWLAQQPPPPPPEGLEPAPFQPFNPFAPPA